VLGKPQPLDLVIIMAKSPQRKFKRGIKKEVIQYKREGFNSFWGQKRAVFGEFI